MDRRRFVKSAGGGVAAWLLNSTSSRSREDWTRADPPVMAQTTWGKVWVRWTEPALPSARTLSVDGVVIPWGAGRALVEGARKKGHAVYAEVTMKDAAIAAEKSGAMGFSGIVLETGNDRPEALAKAVNQLRQAHPHLTFLAPAPGGKQPAMKGSTVITQNGTLQVSSPTEQPWIDSNFALVAFDRGFRPWQIPLIEFQWELSGPAEQQQGPRTEDYALAVAEAGALHADLILNLHPNLQKALARGRKDGLTAWNKVVQYVAFYRKEGEQPIVHQANVGVVTDNFEASYETTNLMARHNVPFRVLQRGELMPQNLGNLDLIVLFVQPDEIGIGHVMNFVERGGVAIVVGLSGPFPWQSNSASRSDNSITYPEGKGKVIELSDGVADPGTFAQDVRRLLGKEKLPILLWNASTTLVHAYKVSPSSMVTLEMLNYSADPMPVQVRIKGSYSVVRYETPERGCCQSLPSAHEDGFTQFDVPWLRIGGRVHLG